MERRNSSEPTVAELTGQLAELGVDESLITQAVQTATQKRLQAEQAERQSKALSDFAVAYKRVSVENASDSNIEGWYESLQASALDIMRHRAQASDEASELETLAANAAAPVYLYSIIETGEITDLEEAELTALFEGCGVDAGELRADFKEQYTARYIVDDETQVDEVFKDFKSMTDHFGGDAELWNAIVEPKASAFYDTLQESGVELPLLGSDGMYAYEKE